MLKGPFYTLVLVLMTTTLSAQNPESRSNSRVSFGASLEAGYSGTRDDISNEYTTTASRSVYTTLDRHRPSYALGLWTTYWLGPRWDLVMGVNFGSWRSFGQAEGERYGPTGSLMSFYRERYWSSQNLLRIPLQTRFYFGKPTRHIRPFLAVGAQAAYLTRLTIFSHSLRGAAGQEVSEQATGSTMDLDAEWSDIRRWQWSVLSGFGIQMDRISLSLQRNWPFINLAQDEAGSYRYHPNVTPGDRFDYIFGCCGNSLSQFRQTSLRLEYRLF